MVGIDPASDGLARAARLGVPTTHEGVDGLIAMPGFDDIDIVFDATSAKAHVANARHARPARQAADRPHAGRDRPVRRPRGQPRRAPRRTERQHGDLRRPGHHPDRGGRLAGGPGALRRDRRLHRLQARPARAPGPTSTSSPRPPRTPSRAVGGAERGKAIIILNPAEPPLIMRDTVLLPGRADDAASHERIRASVDEDGRRRRRLRPRLPAQAGRCRSPRSPATSRCTPCSPHGSRSRPTHQVSVFLEVEGAAHYLPAYAGNLDIMTSAGAPGGRADRRSRRRAGDEPRESVRPGRHPARRHARHPAPHQPRGRRPHRRGPRRGRRRRDRGRPRRRPRRRLAQLRPRVAHRLGVDRGRGRPTSRAPG